MRAFREVAELIRQNEVGRRTAIDTPYGRRLLSYADLTATGRYLQFVESWIRRVRPYYANTHTVVSSTGRVMTTLREEARRVIAKAVNASSDDLVLFVGSGATAAINKLVGLLGLRLCEPLEREHQWRAQIPEDRRPVVFVGPYEHHSNELPWLESVADVVEVGLTAEGLVDLNHLREVLVRYQHRPLKVGSFSAASNVTGILTDVRAVARLLHEHGAYAVFDYAAAGPYVPIDMHPAQRNAHIDALVISTHKFIGGPHGSGLLVVHRDLMRTKTPERPGGGTVEYVSAFDRFSVDYARKLEEREEGGTPAIVGDIRAGVSFLIKDMLGPERVLAHELEISKRVMARLAAHPRIRILGPTQPDRLAIISFTIESLHHDLAATLLDHLFGIQNRSGCSCAGPYGHRLLGVSRAQSDAFRKQIARGILGVKPGWVRVSIPYYANEADLEFFMRAVEFVADHGLSFAAVYRLHWEDGVWRHMESAVPDCVPLELSAEALEKAAWAPSPASSEESPISEADLRAQREGYFKDAEAAVRHCQRLLQEQPLAWNPSSGDSEIDALVWFKYLHTAPLRAH